VQLAEVADGRNAAEIESGVACAALDAGWEVGKHVGRGSEPVRPLDALTSSERLSRR